LTVIDAAVILAGGEARRFGGDKLAALVDGEPSIARIADALRGAGAREVYAVTLSRERCRLYKALAGLDGCLLDPPLQCGGPGRALLAAAEAAWEHGWRRVLVAPGDSPWLEPVTLLRFAQLAGGSDAATVLHEGGYIESLLQLHRGSHLAAMVEPLRALCGLRGELRASDPLRLAPRLTLVGSGLLSTSATAYSHINTREALKTREPRNPLTRSIIHLHPGRPRPLPTLPTSLLREALRREIGLYQNLGLRQLERQARRDLAVLQ